MNTKYTELELATAIDVLIKLASWNSPKGMEELCKEYPCIDEIDKFGPTGRDGLGLGKRKEAIV